MKLKGVPATKTTPSEKNPVWLLFHSTPGCRLQWNAEHRYAERRGVRIFAIDRPGYGHSSTHRRGILGHMEDIKHLLDYYDISEFKVLGVSGGGTYALAAAYYFDK
jgi:pimeloyl-ACP methyl ester carboxylesterase